MFDSLLVLHLVDFNCPSDNRSNQNRESQVCEHALERKGTFDKRCHLLLLGLKQSEEANEHSALLRR